MINRPAGAEEPDDGSHVRRLEDAGATCYRGTAQIVGRGRVEVRHDDQVHELARPRRHRRCRQLLEGPDDPGPRGDRAVDEPPGDARPRAAQEPARPGRRPDRLRDGPGVRALRRPDDGRPVRRPASPRPTIPATLTRSPRRSGVEASTSGSASAPWRPGLGPGRTGPDVIDLDDGTTAEGHAILLAVGRAFPLDDLGLEHYGVDTTGRVALPRDGRLRIADGLFVAGDPAGPELHTHQAHYQGELAVRMALGDDVTPDYRALPRATYTDPEAAFVGADARPGARRPASTPSSSSPSSRPRRRATRSRPRSAT